MPFKVFSWWGYPTATLSLNLYTYALNNPVNLVDPTGHMSWWQIDDLAMGILSSLGDISGLFKYKTLDALWQTVKAIAKGKISCALLRFLRDGTVHVLVQQYEMGMDRRPDKEVKYYGNQLGTALQMVVGNAGAMKAALRVIPKLEKLLSKIKPKKNSSSSYGCNQCFTAGTKVLTEDGEKPIEEIQLGDKVLSKDEETGEVAYKEVVGLFNKQAHEIYYVHIGEEVIEVTGEHPFYLEGKGWTFVKDLQVGDLLVSSSGSTLAKDKIEKEAREATVYNFEAVDYFSYFVLNLGVWVHNCKTNGKPKYPNSINFENGNADWGVIHVERRHVSTSNRDFAHKSKFLGGGQWRTWARDTFKKPDRVSTQSNGFIVYEKQFSKQVGYESDGTKLYKVRVILTPEGNVWTAFPQKDWK
jgi:hypothetical protein